jgi:hypothetical protein
MPRRGDRRGSRRRRGRSRRGRGRSDVRMGPADGRRRSRRRRRGGAAGLAGHARVTRARPARRPGGRCRWPSRCCGRPGGRHRVRPGRPPTRPRCSRRMRPRGRRGDMELGSGRGGPGGRCRVVWLCRRGDMRLGRRGDVWLGRRGRLHRRRRGGVGMGVSRRGGGMSSSRCWRAGGRRGGMRRLGRSGDVWLNRGRRRLGRGRGFWARGSSRWDGRGRRRCGCRCCGRRGRRRGRR